MDPLKIEEIDILQETVDYQTVRKSRTMGVASIIFGLLNSATGLMSLADNPLNMIPLLLGILLLVEGIWLCLKPSAAGFLVDGVLFILLGVWNIYVTFYNYQQYYATFYSYSYFYYSRPSPPSPFWIMLGFYQLVWAYQRMLRYRRFSKTSNEKPNEQISIRAKELLETLRKADAVSSPELIDFNESEGVWKGIISGDACIFGRFGGIIFKSFQDVLIARHGEVKIATLGKTRAFWGPYKGTLKIQVDIGMRTMKGVMKPESLQRYERFWAYLP